MERYQHYFLPVQEFLYDWRHSFDVLIGLVLALMILAYAKVVERERKRKAKKNMGARMTRKERMKFLHTTMGKKISDWLVDMELDGTFTASDVRYLARRGSYAYDTNDIKAERIDFSGLDDEERTLLNSILRSKKELREKILKRIKPNIPGAKPGEVDNVHTFEPKKRKFGHQIKRET